MGRGGSSQKKFICAGRTESGGGCQSEMRGIKSRKGGEGGDWKISHVDMAHLNCSGGVAKVKGSTIARFTTEAIAANPSMNAAEVSRAFKRKIGLESSARTVRRYKKKATDARREANAGTIQQAPEYCRELVARSPGSVATVEPKD